MERPEIEKRSKDIICDRLGVIEEKVQQNTKIREDLNADSLDMAELAMGFEEEFDLEISDADMERISTFRDIVDFVALRLE